MLAGIDVAVAYSVRVRPSQHELDVELTVNLAGETVQLATPTWVPGDYGFASYGRDVFDVQARDAATGSDLPVARDGWQGYRIEGRGQAVRVTYTVSAYSTDFGEPCGLVDSDFAVLTGTRYLRLPAWSGPVRVSYELPAGWNMHHPSGAKQVGETSWEYPSYEILLDTPVVMGRFDLLTRNVKGTPFHFAFVDRALGYQPRVESFVDRVSAVAERMDDIFGSFPFADYTFVLSTNPTADWGLEHLTSTMCGLGPDVFIDDDQFAHGVRVCAHELFHAWNVRRLRPAPLKRLDLTSGSFTEGLWMAEGFTRYYEFLLCTRTGVYTPEQFFSSIVNYYTHLTATPAYERVSAADSSYASYLNHPKYSGRCNNSIDYYDKGMLIAFGLDATLRTENPPDSLDRAFSAFYQAYVGSTSGYSLADVVHFFNEVRSGLGESIGRQVRHAAGLSVDSHLEALGFRVHRKSTRYLGLMFKDSTGPGIYNILDTSPAGSSGIAPEDVLVSVGGFPYSYKALTWVASQADPVVLDVLRGHRKLQFTITPRERQAISHLTWSGTSEQARRVREWLHRDDFAPVAEQVFQVTFYENFHGIETIV